MSIQQGIGCFVLFIFGIAVGAAMMPFFMASETVIETVITEKIVLVDNPIITEKIVTIEIEKPIITQQIVEVLKEVEVYKFIDAGNPVHKWIDPDTQAVVYIYPKGYTGQVMPLYTLVPPVWFEQMLRIVLENNNGIMPPAVLRSVPSDWLDAVAPGANPSNQGFD